MPGHVTKRGGKHRARFPDPLRGGTAQIERLFDTKKDADEWLVDMQHSAKTGTYIDPAASARLLSDVVDEWRGTWTDLEPKTKAGYESILNKHILPRWSRARISAITPDAVQKLVNELAETKAPNTVRRVYTVLRSVLALAVRRRYLATNAANGVKLPKKASTKRDRLYLSPAEIRTLADATDEKGQAMFRESERVALYVAAYCGPRAGELWAFRRRDVDPLHQRLSVLRAIKEINTKSKALASTEKGMLIGPTKTHSERSMRTDPVLAKMLDTFLSKPSPATEKGVLVIRDKKDGGYEWGYSNDPFDPDAVIFTAAEGGPVRHGLFYSRVFKPAVRRALPSWLHTLRWHDLRHTCASLSLSVTPNLHLVMERLGHDDIRTTINTYGHLLPSVDDALAEGLGALHAASNVTPLRPAQSGT